MYNGNDVKNTVKEVDFVKLDKKDVGQLRAFYATAAVSNAAGIWKKSVSIKSPKSGRIFGRKSKEEKSNGFFSRLFEKKVKISDFTYQQSNVRKETSYKPFWATTVVQPNEKGIEESVNKETSTVVEQSNVMRNKAMVFEKATLGSPKVVLTNRQENVKNRPEKKVVEKKWSSVEASQDNALRMPPFYKGSKMRMPTGEQLFWLGETRPSSYGPATYQDFKEIRSRCLSEGRLFEDPEFPAIDRSLYYKERLDRPITWLRPSEICDDPQLFVEGYSRFDVQQGELGDCWLLAAVANLTLHRKLFFQVVPDDQSFDEEYAGVFHFRFWQYGRWVDVVIDDRLPTYRGKLVFLHSSETNEFWSALLEKAYAKLHGSYEALKGGSTCEAMEDFTGGVTEMYEMTELPPNFYTILLKAYERNSLMGCSIEPDPHILEAETPQGLIRGHAYSITRVKYVDIETPGRQGKIPLLRMRNPWGNEAEWNGPWSDKSPEWRYIPESEKQELGLTFDDDGEFWMSFKDFCTHFSRVEICNLNPDSMDPEECPEGCTKKWEMSVFEGEWVRGVTAGGCRNYLESFWRNPQYTVTLTDVDEDDDDNKCTIIVALMQKNRRSQRHQGLECLTIGFAVYRLPDYGHVPKPLDINFFKYNASVGRSQAFINLREVSARFKLPPGTYVIVPSTFEPDEEGEFLVRVFSEKSNNMAENDEDVGMGEVDDRVKEIAPNPEPTDPIREFFNRLAGADGEVDWQELKEILDYAMREETAMRQGAAYDGGGGGVPGGGTGAPAEQSCLEQLLCALCTPICKEVGIDLQQVHNQEQVHLTQPQVNGGQELKGQGFSKDVCRSMIAMLDKDNSGGLGFEEFKSLWIDLRNWRAVFRLYDTEGRGAIPAYHLRDAIHSAGYTVNAHTLNVLAHRYGGQDGYIQFDDFIMCSVRLKTMIETFKGRSSGGEYATFSLDDWLNRTVYS
ncbi:calpain-A isoform X2 [Leguminivora glycinivorella]|uniref:calpain-A isoform X1 n=1 Tax=Leguminivora glycinivorella TaxID=1035111 RepID=UPI00200D29F0|nr:calpain-A isoform X1 [Leguminivora glycinivorella]XP_047999753.1 calpain-A isoform X2 [Leguminivora glycinivorella]